MSIVDRTAGGNGDVPSSVSISAMRSTVLGVEPDQPRQRSSAASRAAPGPRRRTCRSRTRRCRRCRRSSVMRTSVVVVKTSSDRAVYRNRSTSGAERPRLRLRDHRPIDAPYSWPPCRWSTVDIPRATLGAHGEQHRTTAAARGAPFAGRGRRRPHPRADPRRRVRAGRASRRGEDRRAAQHQPRARSRGVQAPAGGRSAEGGAPPRHVRREPHRAGRPRDLRPPGRPRGARRRLLARSQDPSALARLRALADEIDRAVAVGDARRGLARRPRLPRGALRAVRQLPHATRCSCGTCRRCAACCASTSTCSARSTRSRSSIARFVEAIESGDEETRGAAAERARGAGRRADRRPARPSPTEAQRSRLASPIVRVSARLNAGSGRPGPKSGQRLTICNRVGIRSPPVHAADHRRRHGGCTMAWNRSCAAWRSSRPCPCSRRPAEAATTILRPSPAVAARAPPRPTPPSITGTIRLLRYSDGFDPDYMETFFEHVPEHRARDGRVRQQRGGRREDPGRVRGRRREQLRRRGHARDGATRACTSRSTPRGSRTGTTSAPA